MELHWQAPKHSMHGDLVELIAPYPFEPYTIEFGMVPTGDRPPRYYVRCCDHDGRTLPPWEATFPTATEAKAFAERRVMEAERYGPHGKPMYRPFIDGQAKDCRCLYCGEWMVILPGDAEYDALAMQNMTRSWRLTRATTVYSSLLTALDRIV